MKLSRKDKKHRAILKQVNRLAWLLDNSIHIPIINYRIGLDAIIGLIPGIGDVAGTLVSSIIIIQAIRLGAPRAILMRMVLNVAIEATIGLIPVIGDLFDATFKANARNVAILNQAVGDPQTNSAIKKPVDKGAIVLVLGAMLGIVVLIAGAGVALFWWVLSLFTR
jgi:hypothetical protein